jgi:hypothetical protein
VFRHRPTSAPFSPLVGVPPPTNTCTFFSFGLCSATDQHLHLFLLWLVFRQRPTPVPFSPLVCVPPPTNIQVQNFSFGWCSATDQHLHLFLLWLVFRHRPTFLVKISFSFGWFSATDQPSGSKFLVSCSIFKKAPSEVHSFSQL